LVVRAHPVKAGEYEIVAGERRWRASQLARSGAGIFRPGCA
jgi:ParB family chromosome partitioning protein